MNGVSLVIGGAGVAYGTGTLIGRAVRPEMCKKLVPMKQRLGDRGGLLVHLIAYSLMPSLFGAAAIFAGMHDVALF